MYHVTPVCDYEVSFVFDTGWRFLCPFPLGWFFRKKKKSYFWYTFHGSQLSFFLSFNFSSLVFALSVATCISHHYGCRWGNILEQFSSCIFRLFSVLQKLLFRSHYRNPWHSLRSACRLGNRSLIIVCYLKFYLSKYSVSII